MRVSIGRLKMLAAGRRRRRGSDVHSFVSGHSGAEMHYFHMWDRALEA